MNTKLLDMIMIKTAELGLHVPEEAGRKLQRHAELVAEWNEYAGLVSPKDLQDIGTRHVLDSLSLAPVVSGLLRGTHGTLLDIGSGAGFPSIPLRIVLPKLEVMMMERSERKWAFLRKAISSLDLDAVTVTLGSFPQDVADFAPNLVTARAVESAQKIRDEILGWMPPGCSFLCQSGEPEIHANSDLSVEKIGDEWTIAGLRRGELYIVAKS